MRATILAAGVGSRLRPLTESIPKCLVPVAGRPVLGWQIEALRAAGFRDIIVVAGYRAEQVAAFCAQFGDDVRVVINDVYDRTNNMYSLRLALNSAPGSDMVISNGDVVFDETIVADIAAARGDNLIAVEPGRYIEESMKVAVDDGGRIVALNKRLQPAAAYGVSIDLYSFTAPAIASILRTADRLIDHDKEANLWTEVAIEQTLPEVAVKPFDIRGRRWIEIDNFDDLAEGERLFSVAAS